MGNFNEIDLHDFDFEIDMISPGDFGSGRELPFQSGSIFIGLSSIFNEKKRERTLAFAFFGGIMAI